MPSKVVHDHDGRFRDAVLFEPRGTLERRLEADDAEGDDDSDASSVGGRLQASDVHSLSFGGAFYESI